MPDNNIPALFEDKMMTGVSGVEWEQESEPVIDD